MEITQVSTEREQAHDGISSKHPSNSICGLGRATGKKDKYRGKKNPSDFCLFAF